MGTGSKITSVIFRIMEIISAATVVGLVGQYLHYTSQAHVRYNRDLVYTEVIGALSLVFAILMLFPQKYQFYAFPLDFILFILWMVSFGLVEGLVGGHTCSSTWYWQNWGWYYGGYQFYPTSAVITQSTVGRAGCGQIRTVLAFAFIGGWFWLLNGCVGAYVSIEAYTKKNGSENDEYRDIQGAAVNSEAKKSSGLTESNTGDHSSMGINTNVVSPEGPTLKEGNP